YRHLLLRNAFRHETLAPLGLELAELRLESVDVDRVHVREEHRRQVVAHVHEETAERRGDAGARGNEHGRDRELLGERGAVQGPGQAPRGGWPGRLGIGRMASAMFAWAPGMMAWAASTRPSPGGSATCSLIDRSGAAPSRLIAPPINSSPSRPSTRLASVFV